MKSGNLLYRLKQKWNYHTAINDFDRKVAEINRNQLLIILKKKHFKIAGQKIDFNKKLHGFIVDRFDLFMQLINMPESKITLDHDQINFKTGKITLRITTAEEIYIINEIFIKECYNVILEDEFNVIDIGLNVGFASLFFAQNQNIKKIFSYEPFKPTFEAAMANFEQNKKYSQKIIPYNFGLGSKNEILSVSYNPLLKGKNSSLNFGFDNKEIIEIKRADQVIYSILRENPGQRFLIKMDCEGMEFEIFDNIKNKEFSEQLFGFIIEWHYKDPKPIIDILTRNHFKVHKTSDGKLGLIIAFR